MDTIYARNAMPAQCLVPGFGYSDGRKGAGMSKKKAQEINEQFAKEATRYVEMSAALNQRFDILLDLHLQYVKETNKNER